MGSNPCSRAYKAYEKGNPKRAMSHINTCQKRLKKQLREYSSQADVAEKIRLQLSQAYRFEGQLYFAKNNVGKSFKAFKQADQYSQNLPENNEILQLRGQIHYSMGLLWIMRQESAKAMPLFDQAIDENIDANEPEKAIEIIFRVANVYKDLGQLETALEKLEIVDSLHRKVRKKKTRRQMLARAQLEQARIRKILSKNGAMNLLEKSKKWFNKANVQLGVAEVLIEMADLVEDDDKEQSREYLLEALDLGTINDSDTIKGNVYTKLGVLSLKTGDFEKGKGQLLQGLKFRSNAGDKKGTAQTLMELARITLISSQENQDLEKSRKFIKQALDLYEDLEQKYGQAMALELLASIETKLQNLEEAHKASDRAKDIFSEYGDIDGEGRMLTQLGIVLDLQGRSGDSIPVLEKAIQLFEESGNKQGKAEALHLLSGRYMEDDKSKAKQLLIQSRELYEEIIGDDDQLKMILDNIDQKLEQIE